MQTSELYILVRVLVAMVLAGLLGWERETKGKAAGMRTHMLVGMGAALFMAIGELSVNTFQASGASASNFDPIRVLQAVVTGISFIGAGTIFVGRRNDTVQGLTTAASIWATTAVGLLCGLERYALAAGSTVLFFVVLHLVQPLEKKISRNGQAEPVEPESTMGLVKRINQRPKS